MNDERSAPFVWQGRIDAEETGDTTRWHQHVRPLAADSRGGVTLIGFAVDEGVRRTGGRRGAADGPRALRSALAGLPVLDEPAIHDAGDLGCDDGDLDAAQDALATEVAAAIGDVLRGG